MDIIFRLSDEPQHLNAQVEVLQITSDFNNTLESLDQMIKLNGRMIEGLYNITLPNLFSILQESIEDYIIDSQTPILPKNCVKHVWINELAKHQLVYIEVPKQQLDMRYGKTLFKQVGLPRLIFLYEVMEKKVKLKNIVAVKDSKFLTKDTEVFLFPFSHVSLDGHVCMGGNTFPEIDDIYQLNSLHLLFLQAPFGEDYGAKTTTNLSVAELFKKYENKQFDDEILLPHSKIQILENL
ncbi:hypothetical protein HLK66_25535 (plasmid) [Niallia circulans]|uniref:hypothetical protein n=1 Tax=Niallia circulans TaxID=1397 RepID=UPI0014908853|nr:hypothetical protein [Niallia circulans]QJX65053.1 hypothetical protein HLK66_25535 [Niallia circulans]